MKEMNGMVMDLGLSNAMGDFGRIQEKMVPRAVFTRPRKCLKRRLWTVDITRLQGSYANSVCFVVD